MTATLRPDLFSPKPTPIYAPPPNGKSYTGGYAARPGTGPDGATCKRCEHYTVVRHHSKSYRKCGLMQSQWTSGPGSDIKAGSAACAKFEPERKP